MQMHPLKSLLSEAALERKVRGRSLRIPCGVSPGGSGDGGERETQKQLLRG